MNTSQYFLDSDEFGYCVRNAQGAVASFKMIDDAFEAMRDFQTKTFPENWAKIPPATQSFKKRCYGSALLH